MGLYVKDSWIGVTSDFYRFSIVLVNQRIKIYFNYDLRTAFSISGAALKKKLRLYFTLNTY